MTKRYKVMAYIKSTGLWDAFSSISLDAILDCKNTDLDADLRHWHACYVSPQMTGNSSARKIARNTKRTQLNEKQQYRRASIRFPLRPESMNNSRLHFDHGIICSAWLALSALMLFGCTDTEPPEDPLQNMQTDLRQLQGTWIDLNTNDHIEYTAVIQNHTLRIRYQSSPEHPLQKQNDSIQRLDEERKLIIINGGAGTCRYNFLADDHLMLEFFTSDGWHNMHLRRSD